MKRTLIALVVPVLFAAAHAQAPQAPATAASTVQRNVHQQQRIEKGLQNGQLNTREAAALEREQAKVNREQARDLKDGHLDAAERRQLRADQNKLSRDIQTAEHNGVRGNPLSGSSQRMQADVQRNINQQQRVEAGLQDGSLTRREAGRLERGQAHDEHAQARAGADGHVGAHEQAAIQQREDAQSQRIHKARHNGATQK